MMCFAPRVKMSKMRNLLLRLCVCVVIFFAIASEFARTSRDAALIACIKTNDVSCKIGP